MVPSGGYEPPFHPSQGRVLIQLDDDGKSGQVGGNRALSRVFTGRCASCLHHAPDGASYACCPRSIRATRAVALLSEEAKMEVIRGCTPRSVRYEGTASLSTLDDRKWSSRRVLPAVTALIKRTRRYKLPGEAAPRDEMVPPLRSLTRSGSSPGIPGGPLHASPQ